MLGWQRIFLTLYTGLQGAKTNMLMKLLSRFRPTWRVAGVTNITPAFLKEHGVTTLLLDRDDTLTTTGSLSVDSRTREWIQLMQNEGVKLAIVSNSRFPQSVLSFARLLEIAVVTYGLPYLVGKPRTCILRRAMFELGSTEEQTVMVGDQLWTDVLGGNLTNVRTILVRPICPHGAHRGTRLVRALLEHPLYRLLEKLGQMPEEI